MLYNQKHWTYKMTENNKNKHDKYLKAIRKERAHGKTKNSFDERETGRNEGQWPEWYRKAKK